MKKEKREEGAVVVEAAISLTAFMFAIVILLSIVNICQVQARIGTSINLAAKDLSQYSYLYTMAGLDDAQGELHESAGQAKETVDTALNNTQEFMKQVIKGEVQFDESMMNSVLALVGDSAVETVKSQVTDALVKQIVKERLSNEEGGENCDSYLKRVGIREGLNGIDFTKSVFCEGGGSEIKIIADYDVHVLELLGHDITFHFTQCAATKSWDA